MTDVIIHVGCHKTGTTFLQECVFPYIDGVLYYYKPENVEEIPIIGKKPVLISNEEFSRSMPTRDKQLETLLQLKNLYPNAKIIIGVRNDASWMRSCYAQTIKTGGYMSWEEFCSTYSNCRVPIIFYYYCKMMWRDVLLYRHEDLKKDHWKVIKSMCDFMGVDCPKRIHYKTVNVSLKNLELWRWINIITRGLWWRKHIESPWWIATFPQRKILLVIEELKNHNNKHQN